MTSARRQRANRANARASTGPRTVTGKARSARNAFRHGLSISVLRDRDLSADVEALAQTIAGPDATPKILELSRGAAAALIDLARIDRMRHDLIATSLADSDYAPEKGFRRRVKDVFKMEDSIVSPRPIPRQLARAPGFPEGAAKFAAIISDLSPKLRILARYERRTLSRCKPAIRALDQVLSP